MFSPTHAWIIDRDHLTNPTARNAGPIGPALAPNALIVHLCQLRPADLEESTNGHPFRIYGADGTLTYSGRIAFTDPNLTPFTAPATTVLSPLLEYARPRAGSTDIRYLDVDIWRSVIDRRGPRHLAFPAQRTG